MAFLVYHWAPFSVPLPEYLFPATEFATTHRIASDFLSIGYSALIGVGYRLMGSQSGITLVNWLISISVVASAWAFLRQLRISAKSTLVLTAMLSVYPDFLLSYSKVQDTNLTALLLFSFLALLLAALPSQKIGYVDFGLALVLGAATLVRPNLLLLFPLAWAIMWCSRTPRFAAHMVTHAVIAAGFYLAVTTSVHGRPFLPQNGPYNLYAGANEFAAEHIDNLEDSLYSAVGEHGLQVGINWSRQPNTPGIHDLRDSQYKPLYTLWARQYMRSHPGLMVKLSVLKLMNLLLPDLKVHRANSVGGVVKILESLAVPLWLIGLFALPHPGPKAAKLLLVMTAVVYALPFVLTVSAPRFCVALDFVLWMDLGAIVSNRLHSSSWVVPHN